MKTEQNEIKSAKWRKKYLFKNSVLGNVSNNEVAVCDHSQGFYFDEKGIITCVICHPSKKKQTDCYLAVIGGISLTPIEQQWYKTIKRKIEDSGYGYYMSWWLRLDIGEKTSKINYELSKLVKKGLLISESSSYGVLYRLL